MRTRIVSIAVLLCTARVSASPNIPLDDPAYERLAVLRSLGRLPVFLAGVRPITEYDAQRLLIQAGDPPDPSLSTGLIDGLWFDPTHRAIGRLSLFSDEERPYSTPDRPVGILGGIQTTCEHQEGRPCGQGGGAVFELDSAAGWGRWISAVTRFQLKVGSNQWDLNATLDRGYLNGQVGPVAVEIGRDVLAVGPGARSQLLWGDNSAPFDHVRLQTSHPLKIPRIPVTVGALYAVGRLRDPQTFHNTMVTIARLQLTLFDQLELGAQQLLQLDGDGAIHYGFGDFIAEHFTRTGNFGLSAGGSNRRDSLDATYTNKWARGLRIYYELAFEDFRNHIGDMFLYDCDHLLGLELSALSATGKHGFLIELQHNGPFSQIHSYFTSGLTNAGRAVGAPLGPDSWSLFGTARIDLRGAAIWPWFEWAQLSSNHYEAIYQGPILVTKAGVSESRWRIGARSRVVLRSDLRVEARVLFEHVDSFMFIQGNTRNNGGAEVDVVWTIQSPIRIHRNQ